MPVGWWWSCARRHRTLSNWDWRPASTAWFSTATAASSTERFNFPRVARSTSPSATIESPMTVSFVEREELEEGEDAEAQGEVVSFQHGVIDLGLPIRDEILLAVPMTAICRPDCAGICPVCGRNRNLTPCDCEKQALATSKLGALAKIKLQ